MKIKKKFESLLKLFVKKDVAYHFPRRTIHQLLFPICASIYCYVWYND